jgi:hypothetical protein
MRVYFALSGTEVKIGVSANPLGRIKAMQTTRPDIKLLADIPGDHKTEADLHLRFQEFRIAGEWFRFTKEIEDFLKKALSIAESEFAIELEVRRGWFDPRLSELVTSDDLAKRYKVHRRTVQSWVKRGVLPCVVISKRCLRFDPRKCEQSLG